MIAARMLHQMLNALERVRHDLNRQADVTELRLDEVMDNCVFLELKTVRSLESLQVIRSLIAHIVKSSRKASLLTRDKQEDTYRQNLQRRYQHLSHLELVRNLDVKAVSYY